jgi:DNA-binding MarR family transcriptional regulator
MDSSKLSLEHKQAWISFFLAHGKLTRLIDNEMRKAGCVSMEVYDVLLTLELAPEGHLIMSELADRVLLTRSGMTRMTDRLEKLGLVKRLHCPSDRRAFHIAITEEGLRERERAWVIYEQGIMKHFASHLSIEDARSIDGCLQRFV